MAAKGEQEPTLAELIETDFLHCPQCHQRYSSPLLLPCLHAFCAGCLANLPKKDLPNGDNGVKLLHLQCPLCRSSVTMPQGIPALPFLESLCQLYAFKHASSPVCSYCKFDGKQAPADSLCLDCGDDVCEPCANAHRKTRVTRDHIVAPYAQISNGLYDHDIRACQAVRCSKHSLQYVSFCSDCVQLACKSCQTEKHRNHNLESLDTAVAKLRPEAKSFVEGLKKRIPILTEYQDFMKSHSQQLAEKKKQLSEDIQQQAREIHALVDTHCDLRLKELEAAFTGEEATLQSRREEMDVAKRSLQSNAEFVSNLLAVGSPAEVLQLHPVVMGRLKQLVHMKTDTLTQRLAPSFQPGPLTQQNMHIMFGALQLQRLPIDQEEDAPNSKLSICSLLPAPLDPPQLLASLSLKLDSESKEVWPSGLHVYKEQMVVVDRDNKKVKVFDASTPTPTLKFQFTGKGEHKLVNPFDAVLLQNGVVVVSDYGAEKVKVFDITGRWITDLEGPFRHPRGLAVINKDRLVVVDGLLLQLSLHDPDNGKRLSTIPIQTSHDGQALVDPFYVAVTDRGHLVVTDHAAPNVRVLSVEGEHLASYGTYGTSDSEVLKPYGVCVDRFGQLLVADSDNHRVHLLLPDGTFSRFLLTAQHGLAHPVTLALLSQGQLIVGQAFGPALIFKYL